MIRPRMWVLLSSFVLTLGVATSSYAGTYADAVLADNPIGYWRLEEDPASVSTAADSSANAGAQNGTVVGGGTGVTSVAGPIDTESSNNAMRFDGSSGHIDVQDPNAVLGTNFPAWSIEFWMRPEAGGGPHQNPVVKGQYSGAGGTFFNQTSGLDALGFGINNGTPTTVDAPLATNDEWQHVVGTLERDMPQIGETVATIYVNGGDANGGSTHQGTIQDVQSDNSTEPFTIGGLYFSPPGTPYVNHFLGALDEVAIYDYALTEAQATVHFNAAGIQAPTIFEWNGDFSGDYNSANQWNPSGGPPNTSNLTAVFGGNIQSTQTVFTNDSVTVNRIEFDNPNSYFIAGGGQINLGATTANPPINPSIHVAQGSHTFQAAVAMHSATSVTVTGSASQLVFDGSLNLGGNDLTKSGDGTMVVNNQLLTAGGILSGNVSVAEGVLGGSGRIAGSLDNAATVAPGNSPGVLTVDGNYTQSAGGTLAIEVAGTATGTGHDQLNVTATATLDGTLHIQTDAGFTPNVGASPGTNGDQFVIITASSVVGTFGTIDGRHVGSGLFYEVDYNTTNVTLGAFQALEGDANGDKRIDITDFNVLSSNFDPTGQNANDWTNADFNADGNVDITDFNALSSNFAPGGYGDGPGQVPEPTSSILLGLGMLLGIGLWSRVRNY